MKIKVSNSLMATWGKWWAQVCACCLHARGLSPGYRGVKVHRETMVRKQKMRLAAKKPCSTLPALVSIPNPGTGTHVFPPLAPVPYLATFSMKGLPDHIIQKGTTRTLSLAFSSYLTFPQSSCHHWHSMSVYLLIICLPSKTYSMRAGTSVLFTLVCLPSA